jgi:Protein of unknown function (DUF2652)
VVPARAPSRQQGTLLLADISGYTGFLQGVDDAHQELLDLAEPPIAYVVMSTLLDSIVGALAPRFRLAKLEGDAVFASAPDGTVDAVGLLQAIDDCYAAFRGRLETAGETWSCTCASCSRIGELDLKFIVHHGRWVAQSIGGGEELLGPDVNLVHRLLKNHAQAIVGPRPYALLTEATVTALAIPTAGMVEGDEAYDGMPPVRAYVRPLPARAAA